MYSGRHVERLRRQASAETQQRQIFVPIEQPSNIMSESGFVAALQRNNVRSISPASVMVDINRPKSPVSVTQI